MLLIDVPQSQHLISRPTLPTTLGQIKHKSFQGIHLGFLLLDTVIMVSSNDGKRYTNSFPFNG